MEATSLASGAKGKGNAVEQLGEGPPLNMLPACLATHRAARRLPVNDDAVAAGSAAVLGPLALPASQPRPSSLELGVLGLAHQATSFGSPRATRRSASDRRRSGQRGGCRLRCQRNRHCVTPFPGALRPDRVAGGSALGSERVGFRLVLGACQLPPSCVSTSA